VWSAFHQVSFVNSDEILKAERAKAAAECERLREDNARLRLRIGEDLEGDQCVQSSRILKSKPRVSARRVNGHSWLQRDSAVLYSLAYVTIQRAVFGVLMGTPTSHYSHGQSTTRDQMQRALLKKREAAM
jgi:hypothetical protein